MSHRSMINERDARHDARMKQSNNDWFAIFIIAGCFALALTPAILLKLFS